MKEIKIKKITALYKDSGKSQIKIIRNKQHQIEERKTNRNTFFLRKEDPNSYFNYNHGDISRPGDNLSFHFGSTMNAKLIF